MTPEDHKEHAKLVAVKMLLQNVLKRYDICAEIILVGRGHCEILTHLSASWSKVSVEQAPEGIMLKLKSTRADYPNAKAQQLDLEATAGMIKTLAEIYKDHGEMWAQISKVVDDKTGAEHSPMEQVKDEGSTQ